MSELSRAPDPEIVQEFMERLIGFRRTLPPEQQVLLDTLLIAALRPEWLQEVDPYWAEAGTLSPRSPDRSNVPTAVGTESEQHSRGLGTMAPQRQPPTQELLEAFAARLAAFRQLLPREQQCMLDTTLFAALAPSRVSEEEVTAYWTAPGIETVWNPATYLGTDAVAWHTSTWGTTWLNS